MHAPAKSQRACTLIAVRFTSGSWTMGVESRRTYSRQEAARTIGAWLACASVLLECGPWFGSKIAKAAGPRLSCGFQPQLPIPGPVQMKAKGWQARGAKNA